MAITTLAISSNRLGATTVLFADTTSVALDAAISESYILPTAPRFGALLIETILIQISGLSGAYVAPAPAYDGAGVRLLSPDGATLQDVVGSYRFVNVLTQTARPALHAWIDPERRVLMRQQELLTVYGPVLAGAGVTGIVTCIVRGTRLFAGG